MLKRVIEMRVAMVPTFSHESRGWDILCLSYRRCFGERTSIKVCSYSHRPYKKPLEHKAVKEMNTMWDSYADKLQDQLMDQFGNQVKQIFNSASDVPFDKHLQPFKY